MGYISSEQVKEIRNILKKEFPKSKLSVTKTHGSGVSIAIMKSDIDFQIGYRQVNNYYIPENYEGAQRDMLKRINDIASAGTRYFETSDYGSQPSHYVWISIGQWNKPFEAIN